jgi:hypothetical protein
MSRDDFIDPGTGEIRIAALMAAYDEKCEENAALDFKIRQAARSEVALRKELAKQHMDDPRAAQIREVLEYWIVRCHKSSRTKVPMDGVRAQRVRSRMNQGFKVEDLKLAIDGCALKPFVGPMGRVGENVPGTKREDDLELILRDEKYVERFQGYAREAEKAQGKAIGLLAGRSRLPTPRTADTAGRQRLRRPAPSRLPSNAERFDREVQKRVDRANERERCSGTAAADRPGADAAQRTRSRTRRTRTSGCACCPSHDDTSPSLQVTRSPEGNVSCSGAGRAATSGRS